MSTIRTEAELMGSESAFNLLVVRQMIKDALSTQHDAIYTGLQRP